MFYLIPPAGTPVSFNDLAKIINLRTQSESCADLFSDKMKVFSGVKYCGFFNSGRTALVYILKALSGIAGPKKIEVVIPAYTCFSVAAAIARNNLLIRLVDIDPITMDYDYEQLQSLDFSKVLAVVGCNVFGILNDWGNLQSIAKDNGVFLIDDAAQSMGSAYNGKASGSLGDAGFYSLGRGKNMSTYSGGVLLTDNDEIASYVNNNIKHLAKSSLIKEAEILVKIILYGLFLRPRLYWFPSMIPFLGLGETVFDKDFSFGQLTKLQICAGDVFLDNLKTINAARVDNAGRLAAGLLKSGQYIIPGYDKDNCPVYLRLPLLCPDKKSRRQAITDLKKQGIVASPMYPSTIRQIQGIDNYLSAKGDVYPGAQTIVDRLLSLPTHPYLRKTDIIKINNCMNKG